MRIRKSFKLLFTINFYDAAIPNQFFDAQPFIMSHQLSRIILFIQLIKVNYFYNWHFFEFELNLIY